MAQFDVYRLAKNPGLVLDCQSNLLDHIDSRFVVPLVRRNKAPPPTRRLNPVFEIQGAEYVMLTQSAAAVHRRDLGSMVLSLAECDREIMKAIDVLLTGI